MTYKRYIKRDGKVFGPYVYHSRKINGKVVSEYRGKHKKKNIISLIKEKSSKERKPEEKGELKTLLRSLKRK